MLNLSYMLISVLAWGEHCFLKALNAWPRVSIEVIPFHWWQECQLKLNYLEKAGKTNKPLNAYFRSREAAAAATTSHAYICRPWHMVFWYLLWIKGWWWCPTDPGHQTMKCCALIVIPDCFGRFTYLPPFTVQMDFRLSYLHLKYIVCCGDIFWSCPLCRTFETFCTCQEAQACMNTCSI